MLKRASLYYAIGWTQTVEWLPLNRLWCTSVEDSEGSDLPFAGPYNERRGSSQNPPQSLTKYPFEDLWPLVRNMSANSKARLGSLIDLDAYDSVAYRRTEAAICLCVRNCRVKSEITEASSRASWQEKDPAITVTIHKPKVILSLQTASCPIPENEMKLSWTWENVGDFF